jgi:hypothetical protein
MTSAKALKRTCPVQLRDPLCDAGILEHVLGYVGTRVWLYVGAVSTFWQQCYGRFAPAEELRILKTKWWRMFARVDPDVNKDTSHSAAFQSVATLTWAYTSGLQLTADEWTLQRAAGERASLLVLALLHELGLVFGERALCGAVISQREDVVDYLCAQHKCPFGFQLACIPARSGNTSMLRCLRKHGCEFGYYLTQVQTCSIAARGGHFDTLKYLRSEGCSWSTADIAGDAAASGNLDMVSTKYATFRLCVPVTVI